MKSILRQIGRIDWGEKMTKALIRFDRLESLIKETGKKKKFLCAKVGRGEYYINDAKTKGVNIPIEYIEAWAEELGTTADYLTGQSDIKEKPPAEAGDLDAESSALVDKLDYDQLIELIFRATKRAEELKNAQQKLGE